MGDWVKEVKGLRGANFHLKKKCHENILYSIGNTVSCIVISLYGVLLYVKYSSIQIKRKIFAKKNIAIKIILMVDGDVYTAKLVSSVCLALSVLCHF